jgi:type III pantothenate kinase
MSLLCIAVQNSQTMVGHYDESQPPAHWRVATDDRRTADDWGLLISSLLSRQPDAPLVDGVCICSAVPAALHALRSTTAQYLPDAHTVIVGPGVKSGLPVLTDNPREVGTDRIANAIGALEKFGAPCIVVDAGTATTFDVVNSQGQYVGGAIAPGMQISLEALELRGAQLRQVELVAPRSVIAKNTVEALQSGAIFGFAGQVDAIVSRIVAELGSDDDVEVVGTGELSQVLVDHCSSVTRREPWLTIDGLRLIFARNR